MRSFIKAHRKSGSIDRHRTASIEPAAKRPEEKDIPQTEDRQVHERRGSDLISSNRNQRQEDPEVAEFTPSTPFRSHEGQSHTSPTRSSPSFESFHKLASKTKFTSKLFNKNTSTTSLGYPPSQDPTPSNTPRSTSSSPIKLAQPQYEEFPAIKGTITHSWGRSKTPLHIINLNNATKEQEKTEDRRFSTDSWEPTFGTTSKQRASDDPVAGTTTESDAATKSETSEISTIQELFPAFKAHALHDPNSTEEISTESPPFTGSMPNLTKDSRENDDKIRQDNDARRHSMVNTKNKVKNRKITIHSSGDLLSLQKQSTDPNPPTISASPIPKIRIEQSTPRKLSENNNSDFEEEDSTVNDCKKHLSFESDSDSDESKFSFEYSNINGRTSSVKYYRTPGENEEDNDEDEEGENIYIDDLYEDEDFDDDMNYCESGLTHSEESYVRDPAEKFEPKNLLPVKDVKKYGDLFDLSDEDSEEDLDELNDANDDDDDEQDALNKMTNTSEESESKTKTTLNAIDNHLTVSKPEYNLPTKPSTLPPPAKKNISKYNDLFDLSDDESTTESTNESNYNMVTKMSSTTEDITNRSMIKDNTKHHPKAIKRYNDLFDISDDESDNDRYFSETDGLGDYSNETGELKVGMQIIRSQDGREDNKLPFLRKQAPRQNDTVLTPPTGTLRSSTFGSPLVYDPTNGMSPLKQLAPRVLLSPADSDNLTDLSVELKTPKEHLLMLSPAVAGNIENSPSQSNLPPPARSQSLKYHDLNSNLDSEIPGMTSNLFFIDEAEEDEYNKKRKPHEDSKKKSIANEDEDYSDYLDEINTVPEDFEFSDNDDYHLDPYVGKKHTRGCQTNHKQLAVGNVSSFRRTHSFHSKPLGVSREPTPQSNKLELENKTVTFFNATNETLHEKHTTSRESSLKKNDDSGMKGEMNTEGKTHDFFIPSPAFARSNAYSLSPIQESAATTSTPSSPKVV